MHGTDFDGNPVSMQYGELAILTDVPELAQPIIEEFALRMMDIAMTPKALTAPANDPPYAGEELRHIASWQR